MKSFASSFVGRAQFLQTLRTTLIRERKVVITGTSGVGKTATVKEYARLFAQEYRFICWLDMATDETLLGDLLTTLQMLSLPIKMALGIAGLFQTLQQYLSTQQNFLLVLDNPPPTYQFQKSSDKSRPDGHLVVIAAARPVQSEVPWMELTGLEATDGALLVLRRAGLLTAHLDQADNEDRLAALELARELHGWPLALNLAGGYLRATRRSMRDYLSVFRDHSTHLHLPTRAEDAAMSEIAVACDLSLSQLAQASLPTLELLQMCALCLPVSLPNVLFQQEQIEPVGETSEPGLEPAQTLLHAGLLSADPEASTMIMHPLIQAFVRQYYEMEKPQQQVEHALHLFQRSLSALEPETTSLCLLVAGHIQRLAQLSAPWPLVSQFSDEAAEAFSWAASRYTEQGLLHLAEPLLRRALAIWEGTSGEADPRVAALLDNLASLLSLRKNYVEAEVLAHRAIASKSKALGVNHPEVLLAIANLGQVYQAQGKSQEAEQCYEKALSIGDRVNLRLHPVYNSVRYDLALLFIEQKQFEQAEELLKRVCLFWGKTQDAQDPLLMGARLKLAEVYARLRNWERAEANYQQALPIFEHIFGKEHPETLGHLEREAVVLLHLEKFTEANLNLHYVLEARERQLGNKHLALVPCLNSLARVALAQEHITEARDFLQRAQHIWTRQPEIGNLILAGILDTQASLEVAQNHVEQAIDLSQHALKLRQDLLGAENLDLVDNLNNLATFYIAQKQFLQAEPLLLQALFTYQHAQIPDDLALEPVLSNLTEIALERKLYEQAQVYLERLHAIRVKAWGQTDPRATELKEKLVSVTQAQEW